MFSIIYFCLTAAIPFLFTLTPFENLAPQLIAITGIITPFIVKKYSRSLNYFLSIICHLVVFSTGGLNSPFFFLIYFLLFTVSFQNPPSTTMALSFTQVILLSQSLNSPPSVIPLISIVFVTPLAWFIGHQFLQNQRLTSTLATDETDFFLWLTLKFKTGIVKIIDTTSVLLSNPTLPHTQKEQLKFVKDSAKSLLNSSQKLTSEIDDKSEDI
ncbi:MAG: hypothetical protein WCV93_01330 [Candidatus Shapirobacteria bacterium]|jgi:hypothetical protein